MSAQQRPLQKCKARPAGETQGTGPCHANSGGGLFANRDLLDYQLAPGVVFADFPGVAVVIIIVRIVVDHDALVGVPVRIVIVMPPGTGL